MSYLDKIKVADETYDIKDSSAAHSVNGQAPDASGNVAVAVPTKTSELENDSNFQNSTQTAATANAAVATHNTSNTAHADIREATSINAARIDVVDEKIPAQASASNQLADKAFVNSTVQTSSANFRGNWANWAAVPTNADDYPVDADGNKTPTKNDYLVVQDASDYTATTLTGTWRFKYSGEWATDGKAGWHPEYQVNETPLTAAQLAALNSGATAALITKLEDIPADAEANAIDSITVNGTAATPDANKNVNITVPTPPTVVQTTGTSTTDVMSQNAVTNALASKEDVGTTETLTIATSDWAALASSDPYDYSATVTAATTIGANSLVELINDQAVLFAAHGFAIGAISGQSVTIYSVGQPSASVSLKINVKG